MRTRFTPIIGEFKRIPATAVLGTVRVKSINISKRCGDVIRRLLLDPILVRRPSSFHAWNTAVISTTVDASIWDVLRSGRVEYLCSVPNRNRLMPHLLNFSGSPFCVRMYVYIQRCVSFFFLSLAVSSAGGAAHVLGISVWIVLEFLTRERKLCVITSIFRQFSDQENNKRWHSQRYQYNSIRIGTKLGNNLVQLVRYPRTSNDHFGN